MNKLTPLVLLAVIILVSYQGVASFAAIDDEGVSPDNVINSIVEERQKAQEDYQAYKLQEEARKTTPVQIKVPMVAREQDSPCNASKKDIIIGTGLILTAVILGLYLHRLTRKEQVS